MEMDIRFIDENKYSITVIIKNKNNGKTRLPSTAILPFILPEERKNALLRDIAAFVINFLREGTFTILYTIY